MSGARLIAALAGTQTSSSVTGRTILRSAGKGCGCCPACATTDEQQILREASGPGPAGMALSQPGDRAEVEADHAADSVLRAPAPETHRPISPSTQNASHATGAQPLPRDTRAFFEPRFGHSFSSVRVFHDASAAQAARQVEANAFTIGRNIVFGAGRWSPGSPAGRRLLAHELAHVVQQENRPALHRTIQRQACMHDNFKPGGCAGLGMTDSAGDRVNFGVDSLIVELGLNRNFPGKWIGQVYSPPNLRKKGKKFGKIDALKVRADSSLTLEILEIKSRNLMDGDGGCEVATDDALGYQEALEPIRTKMKDVSNALSTKGGYMIPDKDGNQQCRERSAKDKLKEAGLDPKDEKTMQAWCVYNSIQTRMGAPFTQNFNSLNIKINKDGAPAKTAEEGYEVFSWRAGKCGKRGIGRKYLRFQVNKSGGLSYRCDEQCVDDDEQKKEQQDEARFWESLDKIRKEKQKKRFDDAQDDKRAPGDQRVPPTTPPKPGERTFYEVSDVEPFEQGAEIPAEGVDAADVVVVGVAGTAALYTMHLAYQKAKTEAEKALIKQAAKLTLDRMAQKGAVDVAYKLNKPLQDFGKKAFERAIDEADDVAKKMAKGIEKKVEKKLALKFGKEAAKKGLATGARAIARAIPYVTAVIAVVKIFGTAEALAAGADIKFGLGGDDVDVSGDTNVKKGKAGSHAEGDTDLRDTKIELEVDGVPGQSGSLEIKADKFKISGAAAKEGDPITVDLKFNVSNTTITVRQDGIWKGNQIVVSGTVDIIDSDITIDLPPGTKLEPPKPGEKRVIKGVKMVIKKVGTGQGKGGGGGTGAGDAKQGAGQGVPGMESKDKPAADMPKLTDGARKLLIETYKDPNTKKVAEILLSVKAKKPVDEKMIQRLNALKEKLAKHPQVLEEFLKRVQKKPGSDPLKDVIEPLEQALADAEKKKPPPTTQAPGDKDAPAVSQNAQDKDSKTDPRKPPPDKSKSTGISLEENLGSMQFESTSDVDTTRQDRINAPFNLLLKVNGQERLYRFKLAGTFERELTSGEKGFVSDKRELVWDGMYKVTVPNGIYETAERKFPIHFTDGGKVIDLPFSVTQPKGFSKKKPSGGGGRK